ncbi:UDP-N-acetylmuramoylalanyl-D-glutamate-2,6-diaminopimelate ligase [Syntrophomonas zehnderi OL-4]|uniref:UDP-N-acetylmuramoyl-L-alanyl-D-glutamate--2,6-diaminopimelate ligase n=1 Tax=Syntrophomonas zehnderi OL-4 TaxID=690567 RepID=A0A0E4GBU9_9FIRM|nr:UDP-N-acetylmuramoyl-L-alanyl-D-glutamate--2,6-diaminopimelate ligase [Syntrophomonas zehnderi]CFX62601.1 UDP-N-acetylmuramoylalanyl-D-glutamate-2,6-diaminopimelate ligase [Syntrophomonas zehnderi OL-4]
MSGIDYETVQGSAAVEVSGISYDSRLIKPGYLFICIPGFKLDGHGFAGQALENGACVILAEKKLDVPEGVTLLLTDDTRKALPLLAANFYGEPSRDLRVIGVTGTNGKTTTTHLIKAILEEAGKKTGIIGTLYAQFDEIKINMGHTTPESLDIEAFMNTVRNLDGQYVVMEVSSHALDLGRVDRIDFDGAVFTNLTQDHLDYHQTMNRYKESKLKLFRRMADEGKYAVINGDDPYATDFIRASGDNCHTYAIKNPAEIRAMDLKTDLKGSSFRVVAEKEFDIEVNQIGLFNVYNTLAAISLALQEEIDPSAIKSALKKVVGVAGRFEQVDCGQDFTVVVDYAHTPDGLENILKTGRQLTENRLITVFGCGGDRDRTKRPQMGKIAAKYSDFCIVTSDNPRSEEPEAIIDDIVPGLNEIKDSRYARIADRRDAIEHAMRLARKGDLVIIAGKGHETYQLVKDRILDFDDRQVAREILKGLKK